MAELQAEIARLQNTKVEQEAYLQFQFDLLKEKVNKPIHFFQQLFSFLPGAQLFNKIGIKNGQFHEDWLTKSLKVGLPFLVNRVFFKRAGYVKRIVMGLLSTQAAGLLNKERLTGIIDKVTHWVKRESKKGTSRRARRNAKADYNFGIPPDSETF
ncbi:hypothetical protein [Olivibacter ginsenosidimutans]